MHTVTCLQPYHSNRYRTQRDILDKEEVNILGWKEWEMKDEEDRMENNIEADEGKREE